MEPDNQFALMGRALQEHLSGRTDEGLQVMAEIVERRRRNKLWDGEVTYKLAQIVTVLGDLELAESLFSEAVTQGFFCYPYFCRDPLLEPLRSSGRAVATLAAAEVRHREYGERFFS